MKNWFCCLVLIAAAGCGGDDASTGTDADTAGQNANGSSEVTAPSGQNDSTTEVTALDDQGANNDRKSDPNQKTTDESAGTDSQAENAVRDAAAGAGKTEGVDPVSSPQSVAPAEDEFPDATKLPDDLLAGEMITPLNPQKTVFIDVPGKRVLLKSRVCLDRGMLEMFLCLKQTKEHESILTLDSKAFTIHTALLALGAEEGEPAKYEPEYVPPKGQVIDISVVWTDRKGKLQRQPAAHWVRHSRYKYYEEKFETLPADLRLEPDGNLRYDDMNELLFWYGPMTDKQRDECLAMSSDGKFNKAIEKFYKESQPRGMEADFVFVGSGFLEDPDIGRRYLAEGGYVVCVANFNAAMIDISIPSSSAGQESLSFEAWTDRLPPLGSEVLVELVPRQKGDAKPPARPEDDRKPEDGGDSPG